jgi:hypothetical protein
VSDAPTGGIVNCEKAMKMEQTLLANGAFIGAITVGYVALISKDDLDDITGSTDSGAPFRQTLDLQVKAICDSMARLDAIIPKWLTDESGPSSHNELERMNKLWVRLNSVASSYYGPTDNSMQLYLGRLGTIIGSNLRAAIKSRLTIPWYEKEVDNLSLTGMLCDVENFEFCDNPRNFASMAILWIDALVAISRIFSYRRTQSAKEKCNSINQEDASLKVMFSNLWAAAMPDSPNKSDYLAHLVDKAKFDLSYADSHLSRNTQNRGTLKNPLFNHQAAAYITGQVVADVFALQQPEIKPNIEDVISVFEQMRALSQQIDENIVLYSINDDLDWQHVAPRYYEALAYLALFSAKKCRAKEVN